MSLSLGDIVLHFRSRSTEVDSAFTRVEAQANQFAQRMRGRLLMPFAGDMSGFSGALGRAEAQAVGWAERVKGFLSQALVITTGTFLTDLFRQGVGMVKGSIIGMNASLESTTLQFTTLMKDADLARKHVRDLFIFAKDTPFETMPIINASRMLQTFGGNALNTKEHLRTVGDAAAAVSQDIGRVAFWYGRMNNAIKGGTAWGEAGMVLQEMGVLTAETRTKMEQMKRAGADGAAIWGVFANQMSTFDGAMKRMAGTWAGLTSTIADTVNISGATVFKPLFDMAKAALMVVASLLGSTRFDDFVAAAAGAVGQLAGAVQTGLGALLPIAALIWGTFEPLVRVAWEWGTGFVNAFATGISAGANFVADAIGALADMITSFLEPHSPPKILPDLDTWGLKTAQVWMDSWGGVDYSIFETIGSAIGQALQNAVGSGKLKEDSEIPMLSRTKAALAELLEGYRQTGEVSESAMDRLRRSAGPAGEAVEALAEGYLRVEQASRAVSRAQEELNDVTERYDRIINPLSAELDGVRRRMQGLRDAQTAAEIRQKLATATGPDREMLQLQLRELALNRQISAETDARTKAQQASAARVKEAEQEQAVARANLDTVQARQKAEAESIAMARQQGALLQKLADGAAKAAGGAEQASTSIKGVIDDAKTDIGMMQARVGKLTESMDTMRQKGEKIGNAITLPFRLARQAILGVARAAGIQDLPALFLKVGDAARYLATGQMSEAFARAFPAGDALLKRLVALRYQIVRFGIDAVHTWDVIRAGARFLATGEMTGQLLKVFDPQSAVVQGLIALRYHIVAFGLDALRAWNAVRDGAAFLLTGEMSTALEQTFGVGSPVIHGLVSIRNHIVAFGATALQAWGAFREGARFLVTGEVSGSLTRIFESGSLLASWLMATRHRIIDFGTTAVQTFTGLKHAIALVLTGQLTGGIFGLAPDHPVIRALALLHAGLAGLPGRLQALGSAFKAALDDPRGALLGLWGMLKGLGANALAMGRAWASSLLQGLVNALPDGLRTRLTSIGGPLLGVLAGVLGGLGLGPVVAGLLAPLGAVLAPLGAVLAPVGLAFGKLGGLFGFLAPSAGGLVAAFTSLLNPLNLLKGGLGGIIGFLGPLGLMLIQYVKTPIAMLTPLFANLVPMLTGGFLGALKGIGPMLLGLKNPIGMLLGLGRTVLGLISPFGIIMALVGLFAGAFTTNFGGIRDITQTALAPLMPILQQLGPILGTIVQMFMTGDWSGGLAVLRYQLGNLGPLFQTAAGSLQTGIPAIFAVLMQYLGEIGTKVIGWLGTALPPIIAMLGSWALAFLGWIAPMIPPMLESLGGVIAQLLTALGLALPGIVAALSGFVAAFVDWILIAGPPLLMQLGGLIARMLGWVAQQVPGIAAQLGVWVTQFLDWVGPMIPKLLVALGGLLGAFLTWIVQKGPSILEKLGEWAKQFGIWATTKGLPALLESLGSMFSGLWTELQKLWGAAFAEGSIGKAMVDGLKNGIKDNWTGFTTWLITQLHKVPLLGSLIDVLGGAPEAEPEPPGGTGSGIGTGGTRGAGVDGHRAEGGPVRRGGLYLVGERGPEYFQPEADGAIHPNSVFRAITDPLGGLSGIGQGAAPSAAVPRLQLPQPAASAPVATPGGAGIQFNLTIQNPVVDSAERLEQLKREVLAAAGGQFAAAVNRLLLAEG